MRGDDPLLPVPAGHLSLDAMPGGGRLIARPSSNNAWSVFLIDPANGNRTLVPGTDGPLWSTKGDMLDLDEDTVLAIVDDFTANALSNGKTLRYKFSTGDTTVITGGVTIDDFLFYLVIFDSGSIHADIDDGTASGAPDGGVTIDDLLYYLARFDAGC